MLSKKCQYALRAVLFLATESSVDNKRGIRQIAEALNIPSPFLGKILQELVRKHIITSLKGPNGGFYLTQENLEISLLEVVFTLDGSGYFTECGLGLTQCSEDHPCPIHDDFKKSRDHLKSTLEGKTILELANDIKANNLILVR